MDAIDRVIKENNQITNSPMFMGKTWTDFEKACKDKDLIVFGAGAGADIFFYKYGQKYFVTAFVDNNADIQGYPVKNILFEKTDNAELDILVENPIILENYDNDKIVVLISSLRHFEDIGRQLLQMGIANFYSVLCMEAAYRIQKGILDSIDRKQEYYEWCMKQPLDRNKIAIISASDGAGHGKNIVNALRTIKADIDIVWFVRNKNATVPDGVRAVLYKDYRRYTYDLLTAFIWLADVGVPNSMRKKGQIYIQMKHWSSITLKMFGYDELQYRGEQNIDNFGIHGFDRIDYVLVGSEFDERTCRSGFRFDGEAICVGSSRTDTLFYDESEYYGVRERYNIGPGEKCLLFAPTFRRISKGSSEAEYQNSLDFDLVRDALRHRFGGDWRILLRLHPYVANLSKKNIYPDFVTDVSDYYDSEELVAISDVMITDYSSIMFEPAIICRPVFLFADDKEEYLLNERGFLIEYTTLPFPIAETNEQLAENIMNFDQKKYESDLNAFLDKYGVHEDGHASERAAEFILGLLI